MMQQINNSNWFTCPLLRNQPKLRLFCFPYAGGGSRVFRGWEKTLPADIEIHIAQLPGRDKRFLEEIPRSVSKIVEGLKQGIQPYLNEPFAFFGHSMGALLAFELARTLVKEEKVSPLHLFVSGKAAPHLKNIHRTIYNLPKEQFLQELSNLNGTPKEVLGNKELMQIYEPILRGDFEVCDTYLYKKGSLLTCPISAFGGLQDVRVDERNLKAWGELTTAFNQVRMVEGDHFFLHSQQDFIQNAIINDLKCNV